MVEVLTPPKMTVNVKRIMIYSLIPVLSIWAAWRIQKFWYMFGINFVLGGITTYALNSAVRTPYLAAVIAIAIQIPIVVIIIRYFAMEYNKDVVKITSISNSTIAVNTSVHEDSSNGCPNCKSPNVKEARFCATCGKSLIHVCTQCKNPYSMGQKFCNQCGATIDDD